MTGGIPALNELVGLPAAAAPMDMAGASEECFQALFGRASSGDQIARCELLRLRLSYLNWAYGRARRAEHASATPPLS